MTKRTKTRSIPCSNLYFQFRPPSWHKHFFSCKNSRLYMSICRANNIASSPILVLISPFPWQSHYVLSLILIAHLLSVDVEKEEAAKIETNDKSKSPARSNLQIQKYRAGAPSKIHLLRPPVEGMENAGMRETR